MMARQLSVMGKVGLLLALVIWHAACTALIYLAASREMRWTIAAYLVLWGGVAAVWRYRFARSTGDVVFGKPWGIVHGLLFYTLVFLEMGLLFWLFLKTPWVSFVAGAIWIAGYWLNPIFTFRHDRSGRTLARCDPSGTDRASNS